MLCATSMLGRLDRNQNGEAILPAAHWATQSLDLRKSGRVSLSTLNVWMFGSRTTVKKVRNSLTWFSHGSGATLAPEPLVRVPFSTTRVFETLFFFELKE